MPSKLGDFADTIDPEDAERGRALYLARAEEQGVIASAAGADLASLLVAAYPALEHQTLQRPEDVEAIARGVRVPSDARSYRRQLLGRVPKLEDGDAVRRALRVFAAREKLRIAARELMPEPRVDVDETARELSDLAEVLIDVALSEAFTWADARFGVPWAGGERCPYVVLGMGKLGGRELNAGSDVDLLLFYGTDDGEVRRTGPDGRPGVATDHSLHEYFTRVSQRLIATLEDATEDGVVWRVDMRLRPEGSRGPLVNSLASAERYYETWGRTWERAALLRARPVAGDLAFGGELLSALAPFVFRREVNPALADEMISLVARARLELAAAPARDLKLGAGGIREAEFFVQSLQLIWGGRETTVRSTNTLDALRRLRARGLVTDREGREEADAYLLLRRLEHRVQFATGLQTHTLPEGELLERIARSLRFLDGKELEAELDRTRRRVIARLASLSVEGRASPVDDEVDARAARERFFAALDESDEAKVTFAIPALFGASTPDLARHLLALSRRPDLPLGASTRDRYPTFAANLVGALRDAADPEQATRLMAAFFARLSTPSVYVRALADEERATRRLAGLLGSSAFLGASLVGHPELADRMLFERGVPTEASARRIVDEEVAALPARAGEAPDFEDFVGALRRAKGRVTLEVGLADLAGELGTRACTLVLSALADATLDHAVRYAMREKQLEPGKGLAIIAMGKLGGREIGYGSDLDILFAYDPDSVSSEAGRDEPEERVARFVPAAQRVLRILNAPHGDGPGYDLDTRLRPSGNQGLLVVSLESFARYQETSAEDWERQALLKARACAGDETLGRKVIAVAHGAAYERGAAPAEKIDHLRMRMERELAKERPARPQQAARYDLKLGHGGLVDVEFAVQWLQMTYGRDPRVRSTDTDTALGALEACGYIAPHLVAPLREGYRFLRRLEQRLRVLHGNSVQLLEEGAPGLVPLARRMGMRAAPRRSASEALIARYIEITREVRDAYRAVLGLARVTRADWMR